MKATPEDWRNLREEYKEYFVKDFWGFEVPTTWLYAMQILMEKSRWDAEKNNAPVLFIQIKEKFGGLRAYYTINQEKECSERAGLLIDENIAYCEAIVDHTCVTCGSMYQDLKETRGWVSLVCKNCKPELFV